MLNINWNKLLILFMIKVDIFTERLISS